MCGVARLAAEALAGQVTVVDTGSVSLGQGWQVIAAAEAAAAGANLHDVLAAIESAKARVRLWAALDTVEYLRRSGRASALSALLGDLLQIKPLLEVRNGRVTPVARLRTRHKSIDALAAQVEALGALERLAVLHTAAPADAHTLAARLAHLVPAPPLVVEATAVIGTHVGPGALGLAAVTALTR
jgi:DegV family protein with EDD domain